MSFARPDLLWLAVALPLTLGLAVAGHARRRRRVAALLGESALVRRLGGDDLHRFPTARLVLIALAGLALGLAAAGPRWGRRVVETETRALDLVLALDVSKSMWARDLAPDRLERQRLLARRLLRELHGDRIGLVAFAGRAYVLSPLTVDHAALQLYLDALDPAIVSQGGSSLASALRQATDLVRSRATARADRAVVLVTDGEALEDEAAVIDAAERAAAAGVVIFPVGVGTPDGAPVPERDPVTGAAIGYKRDLGGDVVISRRHDALLERIAEITGGRYLPADRAGATERLIAELRDLDRTATASDRQVQERERSGWFIAVALLLLAVDAARDRGVRLRSLLRAPTLPLSRARRRRPRGGGAPAAAPPSPSRGALGDPASARGALALLALGLFAGFGFGDLERGNRLYREGKYAEAVEAYREALADGEDSPALHYNLGTALLRLGRYEEAERHLREALASIDPDTRERTYYNLGNRFLEAGRASPDPEARARLLDAAVEAYKRALRIQPGDVDAKWNLEMALREREQQPPPAQGGGAGRSQPQRPRDPSRDPQGGGGQPSASSSGGGAPRDPGAMTREQAERILSSAEQDERELFRDQLRKGRRDSPVARDW
ncbi:MAG TPA: VWA domain-containing protein [Longimicrobiales bacterium]